jgi:hypothetical protein
LLVTQAVLANDTDAGNDTLHRIGFRVSNGTLTFNGNGTFSYVHNGSETTDSFTYKTMTEIIQTVNTVSVNDNRWSSKRRHSGCRSPWFTESEPLPPFVGDASSVLANDTDAENDTAVLVSG